MNSNTRTTRFAILLSILLSVALAGCSSTTEASGEEEAIHLEIVCPRLQDGTLDCAPGAREAAFSVLGRNENLVDGAEARLIVAGTRGDDWRVAATCRVPGSWGGGSVMAGKAAFIEECRNALTREIADEPDDVVGVPEKATFLGPPTRVYVVKGSRPETVGAPEPRSPSHFGLICDAAAGCTMDQVNEAFAGWLAEVQLAADASFRILVPTSAGTPDQAWHFTIPDESPGIRMAAVSGARLEVSRMELPDGGDDLAGALRVASEELGKLAPAATTLRVVTRRQYHLEAVCLDGVMSDGECPLEVRRRVLQEWAYAALHAPGSTFTLWAAGETRNSHRRFFKVHVPPAWGVGGSNAYLNDALALVTSNGGELFGERAAAIPPGATETVEERRLLLLSRSGAAREHVDAEAPRGLRQVSVVCDLSNSTLAGACSEARLTALYEDFLDAAPGAGSTLTIWSPDKSRSTTEKLWSLEVPSLPSPRLHAYLAGAGRELTGLVPETLDRGSAIAEAISVAVEDLLLRPGDRWLVVLSDMRQYRRGQQNFERSVPQPGKFVKWLEREKLLVDASGVRLLVHGLHHQTGPDAPDFSARDAAQLVETWEAAFAAMHLEWNRTATLCTFRHDGSGRKEVCNVQ